MGHVFKRLKKNTERTAIPTCATCQGRGTIILSAEKSLLGIAVEVGCPECKGTGETGNLNVCRTCNDSKTIAVKMSGLNVEVACPDCSAPVVLR